MPVYIHKLPWGNAETAQTSNGQIGIETPYDSIEEWETSQYQINPHTIIDEIYPEFESITYGIGGYLSRRNAHYYKVQVPGLTQYLAVWSEENSTDSVITPPWTNVITIYDPSLKPNLPNNKNGNPFRGCLFGTIFSLLAWVAIILALRNWITGG